MLRMLLFLAFLPLPALADGFPNACSGTAVCRDGWLSHSQHYSGTCSQHGGVKQWCKPHGEKT